MGVYYRVSILSKLGMKSKVSMKTVERERERVLNLPTYYDNHKELNIRVIRSTVPQNGYILLHLNFVKTVDEIKSQHGNSTQRIKKGTPQNLLSQEFHHHFWISFTPPYLACCSSFTLQSSLQNRNLWTDTLFQGIVAPFPWVYSCTHIGDETAITGSNKAPKRGWGASSFGHQYRNRPLACFASI
jgi:hypothetical protein